MARSNLDVIDNFLQQRRLTALHLQSTGDKLYSYKWWEIAFWYNKRLVIRNGKSFSNTSARQRALLIQRCKQLEISWTKSIETPSNSGKILC